ncbi:hypothetical protein [Calidifontibacillus erzurumensis]|uniref:Spore germination protein GerPC n=1 Tax=Calidifontibacillus erzurumensis TaxID=2741433 RepID=A0A8J8GFR8_9BACI|nr:hypothetical protein [Calidifontibacillus erzurumensis]NSL51001.1 hypothetical protein [Calidifontibacillus erzurumensis]
MDDQEIQAIIKRLNEIEKKLTEIRQNIEFHIHIEKLDIHDPQLKELSFSLDKLDIKELSGALNLGNNFNPKVEQTPKIKGNEKKAQKTHQNRKQNDERVQNERKVQDKKVKTNEFKQAVPDIIIKVNGSIRDYR